MLWGLRDPITLWRHLLATVQGALHDTDPTVAARLMHTLRSGDEVLIRPIRSDDKAGLAQAFQRLGPESRYSRFLSPLPSLSGGQLRYLTEVDHHTHEALVAINPQTAAGLGVARFVRSPDDPHVAEVAVAVVDDWQGRGLATTLLVKLAGRAREEGIERFSATVLADNDPTLKVFRRMGDAQVTSRDHGVVELVMDLPDEGLPEPLRRTIRAVARGDARHHADT